MGAYSTNANDVNKAIVRSITVAASAQVPPSLQTIHVAASEALKIDRTDIDHCATDKHRITDRSNWKLAH